MMSRARNISTSSFPRSKILKNRLGDSYRPPYRHQLCLFCRVHNKQSVEGETVLSGSQFKLINGEIGKVITFFQCTKFRLTSF